MKDKGFVDRVAGNFYPFQVSEELLDAQPDQTKCFSARILAGIEERKNATITLLP